MHARSPGQGRGVGVTVGVAVLHLGYRPRFEAEVRHLPGAPCSLVLNSLRPEIARVREAVCMQAGSGSEKRHAIRLLAGRATSCGPLLLRVHGVHCLLVFCFLRLLLLEKHNNCANKSRFGSLNLGRQPVNQTNSAAPVAVLSRVDFLWDSERTAGSHGVGW